MVVRSDDVDGNDVSGIASGPGDVERRYLAHFTDAGEVVSMELRDAMP